MGDHLVHSKFGRKERLAFASHLLSDIAALDRMLEEGLIEKDIVRIGAEQEFCLVGADWRPSKNAEAILNNIDDPHFTTEIAKFNLEINLDPIKLEGRAFSKIETQLTHLLTKASKIANDQNSKIILTGILPTISYGDLKLASMTNATRYFLLNDRLKYLKGGDFLIHLSGVDELTINHDSVMFEACNTSFQTHLQIDPNDFISSYNWAQAISGPVLGICVNSPLLFGRELWSESRIGLFQQSVDIRPFSHSLLNQQSRVSFGNSWLKGSIVDYFKHEISRHKIIMSKDISKTSLEELNDGQIPKLHALNLHNGNIYRWNRACFGVGNGKAHIRIENRYIPSGPTIIDEMANFAFWVGLMQGRPSYFDDLQKLMDFEDAQSNFIKASRTGSESIMSWMGQKIALNDLVRNVLLPLSRNGLEKMAVDHHDIDRLLSVIEGRTLGQTPAQWSVASFRALKNTMKPDAALVKLTEQMYNNKEQNTPAHLWPTIDLNQEQICPAHQVEHAMTTQLFTVQKDDSASLILHIMRWKNIHHLPVVDRNEKLVGLLTWSQMQSFFEHHKQSEVNLLVSDIMLRNVCSVSPETGLAEAKQIIDTKKIGCLPVVQNNQLIGIITRNDLYNDSNG